VSFSGNYQLYDQKDRNVQDCENPRVYPPDSHIPERFTPLFPDIPRYSEVNLRPKPPCNPHRSDTFSTKRCKTGLKVAKRGDSPVVPTLTTQRGNWAIPPIKPATESRKGKDKPNSETGINPREEDSKVLSRSLRSWGERRDSAQRILSPS